MGGAGGSGQAGYGVPMRRAVALLCAGLGLAACTGSPTGVVDPAASPVAHVGSATSPDSPDPEPAPPTTSPFSGRPGGIETPVVVVKVDNTRPAQPHRGLTRADIVYVEPVEWDLTRIAAVFSTDIPEVVGPVRSARIGDLSMLEPLGSIAFVFSGAQQKLWPKLRATQFHLISEDLDSRGFYREGSRIAPVNLMATPREMLAALDGGDVAVSHDIGFVFDPARPPGGTKAKVVTSEWDNSSVAFRWNKKAGAYDVWINGRQARDVEDPGVQRATTVIIQYVKETDSRYGDKFGGVTPLPRTVGRGRGLVLRNGRSYPIAWSRPEADEPTAYLGEDGEQIAFDPGQVWIVVRDRTRPVTVE